MKQLERIHYFGVGYFSHSRRTAKLYETQANFSESQQS
jgi:hypothetical protein